MDKVEQAIVEMLKEGKVFYTSLLLQMNKNFLKNWEGIAAVSIENGRIYLYYSSELIKMKLVTIQAILEHEVLHLVFEHILRRKGRKKELFNIAADIAINSMIEHHLPKGAVLAQDFNLPPDKNAEWYYEKLPKNLITIGSRITTSEEVSKTIASLVDDHSKWKDLTPLDREVIKQSVEKAFKEARSRGELPLEIEEQVKKLLAPPILQWTEILRSYVGNKIRADLKLSWKRESRRFGVDQKGTMRNRKAKIVIAMDTSGSIDETDFISWFNEVRWILSSYKAEILLIQNDAKVHKVFSWRPYQNPPKYEVIGRGGTDFRPVFNYIKEHHLSLDLLIFFTDLDGTMPDKSECLPYQVLWIYTHDGTVPFGRKIKFKKIKHEF